MNTILITVLVLGVIAAVIFALKSKKSAANPATKSSSGTVYIASSPEPLIEAGLWASNYWFGKSEVCQVGDTDSMLPLLQGNEWAVLAHDFDNVKIGSVVAYRTVGGSSPAIGSRLVHRVVSGNATNGWLPQGDTPGQPVEDWNPITRDNYIGTLVAAFRKST